MPDLQKANMWKRISAALLDGILLGIVAVGVAFLLSAVLGYDAYSERLDGFYQAYEQTYGLDFDIQAADYEQLPEDVRAEYDRAWEAFAADAEVNRVYGMLFNLTLLIITFAVLAACLLLEFLVPLLFGNGQTLGKKVFGIAVMRRDGVRIAPILLFARTVLGKYTVETMLPLLILIMIYFNAMGALGVGLIGALLLGQLILLATTRAHTPIHDLLAHTVTVDMACQMIFDSPEALIAYQKRIHAEAAERSDA